MTTTVIHPSRLYHVIIRGDLRDAYRALEPYTRAPLSNVRTTPVAVHGDIYMTPEDAAHMYASNHSHTDLGVLCWYRGED